MYCIGNRYGLRIVKTRCSLVSINKTPVGEERERETEAEGRDSVAYK